MSKALPPIPANIAEMQPYKSARSILKGDQWIFMDAGECPEKYLCDLPEKMAINNYPDPTADELRKAIGEAYSLPLDYVFVGCGIDEILDLTIRTFSPVGSTVLSIAPSFPMYQNRCQVNNREYATVPLNEDFSFNEAEYLVRLTEDVSIAILCTPNNPTGTTIDPTSINNVIEDFNGLVLVDEAYGEFATAAGIPSAIEPVKAGAKNVLVTRTFSKAYRAAGIRLGYAIACPELITELNKTKLPYNVNSITQAVGIELIKDQTGMQENVKELISRRAKLAEGCVRLGCTVSNSITHFFLLQLPAGVAAETVYERLKDEYRIAVRPFGNINGRGSLRVSTGTDEQNKLFLKALAKILNKLST